MQPSYAECLDPVQSLNSDEKRIVVFVSSTFRDMVGERDELTLRVFPELRKICEDRGIIWGEVDLRWGIPPEKEQDQVLETCLRFIDRCRPYFIGILGERYGWTDVKIAPELAREFPWLTTEQGRSVTELEILHGVLNDPAMADHASFYIRNSAYIETLPESEQGAFREGPMEEERHQYGDEEAEQRTDERRLRLTALKTRIRASGLPLHESYPDPVALGQLVREDLLQVIEDLAPLSSEIVTEEERVTASLDREATAHDAFARSRFGVYVPQQEYFDRLDAHADGDGPPLVVTGESGAGKSALLAHWTDRYKARQPDSVVIRHFVGATSDSADLTAMLHRFMGEFTRQLGVQGEIPADDADLRAEFPYWLAMAAARGRVVLVIDALNQLEDRHGGLDLTWLPPVVPANVRLVVSTLPGRPLDAIAKRGWPALEVGPLTIDERKRVIRCYLRRFFRELGDAEFNRIAAAEQAANPLFLRAVLEELRVHGTFDGLPDQIRGYLEIPTIPKLYEAILARYERDYERDRPGLVRDLCRCIWASRRGLSREELRALLGDDRPLPDAHWAPLLLAMQSELSEKGGVLTFFHNHFREAVRARYLPNEADVITVHIELVGYFEKQPFNPRQIEELPWQMAAGKLWDRLVALLTEPSIFLAVNSVREYDLRHYWVQIEGNSPYKVVAAYIGAIEDPSSAEGLHTVALLLNSLGHPKEAGIIWEKMFAISTDPYIRLQSISGQAIVLNATGDRDGAMKLFKEQERLSREIGKVDTLARALGNQALILRARGDLDGAMEILTEIEHLFRELGDIDDLQRTLGNRAWILMNRGDLEGAMGLLKEQERICRDLGKFNDLQQSLGNQALILKKIDDLDGAMKLHKEEEHICRAFGNVAELQACLGNMAMIFTIRGDLDTAMKLLKEQEATCRELGDAHWLQVSLGYQAVTHIRRREYKQAMELLKEQEGICRELREVGFLQQSLHNQGLILKGYRNFDSAMYLFIEQEQICRETGNLEGLALSLSNQAVILGEQGLHVEASRMINDVLALAEKGGYGSLVAQIRKNKRRLGI